MTCATIERVHVVVAASEGFVTQVTRALETILDDLSAQPAPPTPDLDALVRLLRERSPEPPRGGDPEVTAQTLVGAVYEVLAVRMRRGEADALPALLPDLTYSVLLPYLGHDAAAAERERLLGQG